MPPTVANAPSLAHLADRIRQALPEVMAVYAFGSRIEGTHRDDSDLDLAVLVAGYADPIQLWQLAQDLSGLTHSAVDLLDLRAASTVMQHQILTKGIRLYGREPEASLFECYVMAEKNDLDDARRPLLNDIADRGSVYG